MRWDNGSPFTADFFYEIGEMTGTAELLHERRAAEPYDPRLYSSGKPEDES